VWARLIIICSEAAGFIPLFAPQLLSGALSTHRARQVFFNGARVTFYCARRINPGSAFTPPHGSRKSRALCLQILLAKIMTNGSLIKLRLPNVHSMKGILKAFYAFVFFCGAKILDSVFLI